MLEIAAHPVLVPRDRLHMGAAEGDGGVQLGMEEIRRAQVGVALRLVRGDGGHVDGRLSAGRGEVAPVELERPAQGAEATLDGRDQHVLHPELRDGMGGVDGPCR
jgi:hypothetical protein